MGKVIKGSADSGERYTVAIPKRAVGPSEPGAPGAELLGPDGSEPPMVAEPAVSAEPAADLEAMQANVQEIVDEAARSAQLLIDDAELRAAHARLSDDVIALRSRLAAVEQHAHALEASARTQIEALRLEI